jgi:hypothetical protein
VRGQCRRQALGVGLCGLFLLAMLPASAVADLGAYRISRFHTVLQVEANSDLIVEETIEVEFSESRHGIYREIPVRYTDPSGYLYDYRFKVLGIEDAQGNERPFKLSRRGASVRLRIGSADRKVSGHQVYVIRYRATDVLRQFGEHDELYWNVTGHNWNTTIAEASVQVLLPERFPVDSLSVVAWSGSYGTKESNARYEVSRSGDINIWSEVALDRMQGLTVAVAFPPGAVRFPGKVAKTFRFVTNNIIVVVPFLALIFLVRRYRQHGIDPDIPTSVMVRYEPPKDVTPGVIGTLVDERVDMADITATIVDLAVRGVLVIRTEVEEKLWGIVKKDVTSFTRTGGSYRDLLPHEKLILDGLFANGSPVTTEDLKEEFYKKLPGIRTALYERLAERGFVSGSPEKVRQHTVALGVVLGILTGAVGIGWAMTQGSVFPNAAVLPVVSAMITIALFTGFAPAMPRRTHSGVRVVSWSRGFEEFAQRVEEDKWERAAARDLFESLLPYAMALGVATKWSRKFEGIYDDNPPSWYVGSTHNMHRFSTVSFQSSLSEAMTQAGQSLVATPRSSGSSGFSGGSSGGGGGGGGGGSW